MLRAKEPIGSSGLAFRPRHMRMGICNACCPHTLTEGDVLVAISSSGQPAELLDSVTIARQYGAATISLTKTGSDLAQLADISIQIDIPEDQDIYKPSASRLVYIAIVDVLAAGAARKRPERVKENLRRIRTSLLSLSKDAGPKPIGD